MAAVQEVLVEAARFARARRHPMWPRRFPLPQVHRWARRGDLYVATVGADLAGVFLLQRSDPATWGRSRRPARYLHRLAVRRAFAGRGLGRRLVEWAAHESARAGAGVLRLDTVRANSVLRAYYRALGFREVGERRVGRRWLTLFERPLPRAGRARAPIATGRPGSPRR